MFILGRSTIRLAVHDGVKPDMFSCRECGKAYMNSNALNYHMKKHGVPVKFSSEECGKQFVSEAGLNGNIEVLHRKMAKKFECENCLKSYSSISNLNKHRKIAHLVYKVNNAFIKNVNEGESVDINCKLCEKKLSRNDALKRHIKTVHRDVI